MVGKLQVYVWGFPQRGLGDDWPSDLAQMPVRTGEWPAGVPVLVHADAAAAFQAAALAHPLGDGRLPDAILYLPVDQEMPAEAAGFFDASVVEGDWEMLRDLLACPQQFRSAELAEDLPAAFVAAIDRPVPALDVAALPLPADRQQHLAACRTCRSAFDRTLEERLILRRMLLCPPVERLAAVVRGMADRTVAAHVQDCRFCQAQMAGLRLDLAPAWQRIPLVRATSENIAALTERARRALGDLETRAGQIDVAAALDALAAFVVGASQAQLVPIGVRAERRTVGEAATAAGPAPDEVDIHLVHQQLRRNLHVGAVAGRNAIQIHALHDKNREIEHFRVEIRRQEDVLWPGTSKDGAVEIPLDELNKALAAGADAIVIAVLEPSL